MNLRFITFLTILLISFIALPNAHAGLLTDYSSTSAGGNLAPIEFDFGGGNINYVHFAVFQGGDPLSGESGYQTLGPPVGGELSIFGPVLDPGEAGFTSSIAVGASDYLYVYQIDSSSNAVNTSYYGIGTEIGGFDNVTSIGFTADAGVGDIFGAGSSVMSAVPFIGNFSTGAGGFAWSGTVSGVGQNSSMLFYTSPSAPRDPADWLSTTMNSGGGVNAQIVSPMASLVPEPVSSTLFIIGGATLGFRRLRRKMTK